jgi:Tol biopolymer transport system component
MIGQTISHYRIAEMIGAGGMGLVYRAEDLDLGRWVALKFLGAKVADSPEAAERFLREARIAAAISHPNICTVYEVGWHDGRPFLAMELLEGDTLFERLGNPIASSLVVRWAIEIAEALDAANAKGIIHRDLKPSNIFITARGEVKLLDFGLAKRQSPPARSIHSDLPTNEAVDPTLTGVGQALGTVAYMSPEQARGDEIDSRSDLFSLGAVIYEVAGGRQAFAGATSAVVFDAILNRTPPPLSQLRPELPAELDRIVAKALEKDRELRYQSAAELRADLKRLRRDTDSSARSPTAEWTAAAGERRKAIVPRPLRTPLVVVVAVAAVAGVLAGQSLLRSGGEPAAAGNAIGGGRLTLLVSSTEEVHAPSLSPEGKMVVYVAEEGGRFDLYAGRVAGGDRIRLTDDDDREGWLAFSPDGEQIAYSRRRPGSDAPEVCIIPALGGEPKPVVPGAMSPAWSPDGRHLSVALARPGEAMRLATVASDGSDLKVLLEADGTYPFIGRSAWAPDGRQIAFTRGTGGSAGEIWLVPVGGGKARRVPRDPPAYFARDPVFTPDGRGLIVCSNRSGATNLWLQPLDGGDPRRLTTGAGPDEWPSVSRDGTIAFQNRRSRNSMWVRQLDTGLTRELATHAGILWAPAFSPDGREIAFSRSEADGAWHVWTIPVLGGRARQLTSGALPEIYPRYTPDGATVVYFTWSSIPDRVWRTPRAGGPASPVTPEGPDDDGYGDVSPDGSQLVFSRVEQSVARIHVAPLGGGEARRLTDSPSTLPRWSPDGRLIAFGRDRGYLGGVFVIAADGSGERRLAEIGGWPVWWPDGKRIGYLAMLPEGNQEIRTVGLEGGTFERLVEPRFRGNNFPFDVSRDGNSLAYADLDFQSAEIWILEPGRSE